MAITVERVAFEPSTTREFFDRLWAAIDAIVPAPACGCERDVDSFAPAVALNRRAFLSDFPEFQRRLAEDIGVAHRSERTQQAFTDAMVTLRRVSIHMRAGLERDARAEGKERSRIARLN